MDVGFWAARVHTHIPSVQSSRNSGDRILVEDEGGEEVRAWFPCPFCYVEIELHVLCVHLQEEHCFNCKNAVCPICAANLGKDAIGHFAAQHAHSIKRRKKSQKSGFWSDASPNIIKDLSSFLVGNGNAPGSGSDPLVSPFLCPRPQAVPKQSQTDHASSCVAESKSPCLDEAEGLEEMRQRVAFVHDLVISTIFLTP